MMYMQLMQALDCCAYFWLYPWFCQSSSVTMRIATTCFVPWAKARWTWRETLVPVKFPQLFELVFVSLPRPRWIRASFYSSCI